MLKQSFAALLTVAALASPATAAVIDFNSGVPAGVSLGGQMLHHQDHLYNESYNTDDYINFSGPVTVNSFQMNLDPWQGYGTWTGGNAAKITVQAFNAASTNLWQQTVDLTTYNTWNNWLTVNVNVANVSTLRFIAPGSTGLGFWPSVDNLIINEALPAAVPEPASLALFGLAALGLGVARRRQRK